MAPRVSIRYSGNRYLLFAAHNGRRTRVGSFSTQSLSYAADPNLKLDEDVESEVRAKVNALETIHHARTGVLLLSLLEQLTEFQHTIGVSGPGETGPLFEDLEGVLRTTLKKVQRMNALAVRRQP